MKLAKISKLGNIVSKREYVCNNIDLLCIKANTKLNQIDHTENNYQVLFSCRSSIVDEIIFIFGGFTISPNEFDLLKNYLHYLPNIMNNDKFREVYEKVIENMNPRNMYMTDFTFGYENKSFFLTSYRNEGSDYYTENKIYLNQKEYIRLQNIINGICKVDMLGALCQYADNFSDLKMINCDEIFIGETTIDDKNRLLVHYRLSEAALHFDLTFYAPFREGELPENPDQDDIYNYTSFEEYNETHGTTDTPVWTIFDVIPYKDDSILILYNGYPLSYRQGLGKFVQITQFSTYGIILNKDQIKYTNFLDFKNIIVRRKNNEENNI